MKGVLERFGLLFLTGSSLQGLLYINMVLLVMFS